MEKQPQRAQQQGRQRQKGAMAVESRFSASCFWLRNELGPALSLVCIIAALLGGAYYAIFHLSAPTVYANPGVEAYRAPLATRLVPQPRMSDAPDLPIEPASLSAPLPDNASSGAKAATQAGPAREAAPSRHARASPQNDPHGAGYPQGWGSYGYSPQWVNPGYVRQRDSSSANGWSANGWGFTPNAPTRAPRGGPKSQ
jgi:hypothetical protein